MINKSFPYARTRLSMLRRKRCEFNSKKYSVNCVSFIEHDNDADDITSNPAPYFIASGSHNVSLNTNTLDY